MAAGIQEPHYHRSIQSPRRINGVRPPLSAIGLPLPRQPLSDGQSDRPQFTSMDLQDLISPPLRGFKEMGSENA